VKERRQRTTKDMLQDMELEAAITERFKAERHPEATVDGDDRWEMDLYEIPDDELPGMWERADFMGGAE
jgi:hypothetical protein